MINCKDFNELTLDDIHHLSCYSQHLFELIPIQDDIDLTIYKNMLRHIIEILEKEDEKNS